MLSDRLDSKILSLMECIWNLDGNCDEREIKLVANCLRDLEQSDFDELQELSFDDLIAEDEDDE